MWPGFNSRTQHHMWVVFLVLALALRDFFSGYSSFPFSSKSIISKFQSDLESEGHRFVPSLNRVDLFYFCNMTFSPIDAHTTLPLSLSGIV